MSHLGTLATQASLLSQTVTAATVLTAALPLSYGQWRWYQQTLTHDKGTKRAR